ncbi:hypothetical protein NN561_003880 [Cricetulus griseus]
MCSGWGRGAGGSVRSPFSGVRAARAARGDTGHGTRRVSPPGPVCRPRVEQEAVPATRELRSSQARGARAFRGDATDWSLGHASLVLSRKRRGSQARRPFRSGSHAFGGKGTCVWGLRAERDRGEGLAGLGGDIWSFGHNWRPSRRARGEAKHKAGSRSRRPPASWGARFPSDPLLLGLSVAHSHSRAGVRPGAVP